MEKIEKKEMDRVLILSTIEIEGKPTSDEDVTNCYVPIQKYNSVNCMTFSFYRPIIKIEF